MWFCCKWNERKFGKKKLNSEREKLIVGLSLLESCFDYKGPNSKKQLETCPNGTDAVTPPSSQMSQLLGSRSTLLVIVESTFYGAIATLAFFGNLLVLYVVYKNPRLRNGPGWMVTSLAISDITMSSLCAPPSLAAMISGRWISGFVVCQAQGFLTMWLACASLETMALMSVDRYYRVVRPVRHRTLFTVLWRGSSPPQRQCLI